MGGTEGFKLGSSFWHRRRQIGPIERDGLFFQRRGAMIDFGPAVFDFTSDPIAPPRHPVLGAAEPTGQSVAP
jgi:hypothetical protein